MVKSYKGLLIPREVQKQQLLAKDYMATKLIKFHPNQRIFQVMDLLLIKKIGGGPVVNEFNEVVGMISETDCMKEVIRGKYHNMPIDTGMVSQYMSTNVVSISPEVSIFEVANLFLEKRMRRFPVIEFGKLVGQISQKDVIRAFKKLKSDTWW
ncbi:MAG: CBS domain-containing protein [Flammeovirgaceae bacterium]|nr:CBS domain-containing protein [Flammeovirgaceae bacterium]|tara:strand:+ start:10508 stop:10966 length:459 start_codon:yes stop_codon:yes gene_type:complete